MVSAEQAWVPCVSIQLLPDSLTSREEVDWPRAWPFSSILGQPRYPALGLERLQPSAREGIGRLVGPWRAWSAYGPQKAPELGSRCQHCREYPAACARGLCFLINGYRTCHSAGGHRAFGWRHLVLGTWIWAAGYAGRLEVGSSWAGPGLFS